MCEHQLDDLILFSEVVDEKVNDKQLTEQEGKEILIDKIKSLINKLKKEIAIEKELAEEEKRAEKEWVEAEFPEVEENDNE
jgi:hypothetical protein